MTKFSKNYDQQKKREPNSYTQRIERHTQTYTRSIYTTHSIAIKEKVPTPILSTLLFSPHCCDHKSSFCSFFHSLFIHWNVRDFVIVCKPHKKNLIIAFCFCMAMRSKNHVKTVYYMMVVDIGRFFVGCVFRGGPTVALSSSLLLLLSLLSSPLNLY